MPENLYHYANILKFWRSVETFTLPDIPTQKSDKKEHRALGPSVPLPWEPGELYAPSEGKQWRHVLYFHIVSKESVVALLAKLTGSKEYRELVGGKTCFSALVIDHLGQPIKLGYSPAAYVYGIKSIIEKTDPEELTQMLAKAQESYLLRFQLTKEEPVDEGAEPVLKRADWGMLESELIYLQGLLGGHSLQLQDSVYCVSEQVSPTSAVESPFLNSYYLDDLNMLINNPENIGRPLGLFLSEQVDVQSRHEILEQGALLNNLHPGQQCPGRWPSKPAYGLYSAQQVALYRATAEMRDSASLIGVNGPPGTGKTTLLKEIVVEVVVSRAKRLLEAGVSSLLSSKWKKIADMVGYYPINSFVVGNDGIVVSSNNNAAILNISKELPLLSSIDLAHFKEHEYFSRFATNIHPDGASCWAMISAVLGKSDNRSTFVNKFWFNQGNGFGKYLQGQYEEPGQHKHNEESYQETAQELNVLLKEYEVFQSLVSQYHDLLLQVLLAGEDTQKPAIHALAAQLMGEYGILPENLPDLNFLKQPLSAIHRMMPYSSEKVNLLRSHIFLRSLELHEWAIRLHAKFFRNNLSAFVDLLRNKHGDYMDEAVATDLWNSFFFCIPLVSVTLASFRRQFSKMGRGTIGWLLLDEAGQATPASACGAIWRAQRSIIIGDTLQIPPVVTIPKGLGKLLQDTYQIKDECWSPLYHSVQFLADRVTSRGAYIGSDGGGSIWTGLPLRAHRRCGEPMFSIANAIAYDNQMVKVTQDVMGDIVTGPSGWIDVKGTTIIAGHGLVEELQVLKEFLQRLINYTEKIYVISPFRVYADCCREEIKVTKGRKIEFGTIHTFQGKEAEIVFLILGTLPGSTGARDWVADSPNMLNVAVTRAKERLYVIGNRDIWKRHRFFDFLVTRLPEKSSGRLF